jgi:hypothetical protein
MSHTVVLFLALFLTANANAATYRIFGEGSPERELRNYCLGLGGGAGIRRDRSEWGPSSNHLSKPRFDREIGGNTIGGTQLDQEITFYDFREEICGRARTRVFWPM